MEHQELLEICTNTQNVVNSKHVGKELIYFMMIFFATESFRNICIVLYCSIRSDIVRL